MFPNFHERAKRSANRQSVAVNLFREARVARSIDRQPFLCSRVPSNIACEEDRTGEKKKKKKKNRGRSYTARGSRASVLKVRRCPLGGGGVCERQRERERERGFRCTCYGSRIL